jgi:hypothetical protein
MLRDKLMHQESTNRTLMMLLEDQGRSMSNTDYLGPDNIC